LGHRSGKRALDGSPQKANQAGSTATSLGRTWASADRPEPALILTPARGKEALALGEKHGLTVYDAAYLELARRYQLPLATVDGDLRKAAQAEGVPLL
jgi:predicted nucleic acid-binding protein